MNLSPAILARAQALHAPRPSKSLHLEAKRGAAGTRKSFDAAGLTRLTGDWNQISRLSADAELQGKLPIIRGRARDHERNEALAESHLKLRENNVVGPRGFLLEMKAALSESIDPETGAITRVLDHRANRAIEKAWREFQEPENFLVTRDLHAIEAWQLMERTWQRDGDFLLRIIRGAPNKFGFAFQLLEADYLDDQFVEFRGVPCQCPRELTLPNGQPFPYCQSGRHEVRMGVELQGDWKFPVAYWLLANHPGDYFFGNQYATRRIRVPVGEIIHPLKKMRIEQTRGLPAGVAAMLALQLRGGMQEASVVRARASAQKMGFLTKEIPSTLAEDGLPEDYLELKASEISGAPGEILELEAGFDLKVLDWKGIEGEYDPFLRTQDRDIASSLGVSVHGLTGNLSDVNFSAARIGDTQQRDTFRCGQGAFERQIIRPGIPPWLEAAILSGQVDLSFERFAACTEPEAIVIHGRGWDYFDPKTDVEADIAAIGAGLDTRQNSLARRGRGDFDQVNTELGREKKARLGEGLEDPPPAELTGDGTLSATPPPTGPGKSFDPSQPRDQEGKWTAGAVPAHFGEVTPFRRPPTEAERAFVENYDSEEPSTWGRHATPEVLEQAPLFFETDYGARVKGSPEEWPEEAPETAPARELHAFVEDDAHLAPSEWPIPEPAQKEAQAFVDQHEGDAPLSEDSSDDELESAAMAHLPPAEYEQWAEARDTSEGLGEQDSPETRAAARQTRHALEAKAIATHNEKLAAAQATYQGHYATARANAKEQLRALRGQLNARVKQARATVGRAYDRAERAHGKLSEHVEEYDLEQEAIHTRRQLLTLRESGAFDPANAEHAALLAKDRDLNWEDWQGAPKA